VPIYLHLRIKPRFDTALSGAVADADLILEVRPEKNRVYLHEAIPVTVTLLAGAVSVRVRDIQFPRLAGAAFRVTGFAPPQKDSAVRDGHEYAAYQFSATLVPRRSGDIELGPAELRCDVLAPARGAAAFFGGSEPRAVTLRSQSVHFSILPLPTRGRPADFGGAVGHFRLTRQVTPTAVEPGSPVTVTTRIEGVGKIDTFSCPSILLSGVRSYPPRVRRTGKGLTCDQVLVPETAVTVEIPAARVSYFDPRTGRYGAATSPPVALRLTGPLGGPERDRAVTPEAMRRPASPPAERFGWPVWLAIAALAVAAAGAARLGIKRRRATADPTPNLDDLARQYLADAAAALAADDPQRFYEAGFRVAQTMASTRWTLPPAGIAACPSGDGIRADTAMDGSSRRLAELFGDCDAVRYGGSIPHAEDMARTLRRLQEAIADLR
jgi:hypothetical protein